MKPIQKKEEEEDDPMGLIPTAPMQTYAAKEKSGVEMKDVMIKSGQFEEK